MTLRENALNLRIQQTPCGTPDAARQFVRFGLRCIQGTPLTGGLTPASRVADAKPLCTAIQRIEDWLAGRAFGHFHEEVRAAATLGGPYKARMSGQTAASWSVCHLSDAVRTAIRAGNDVSDLNDVGMNAGRAAAYARCSSDEGVTLVAIEYQEQLLAEVFGKA